MAALIRYLWRRLCARRCAIEPRPEPKATIPRAVTPTQLRGLLRPRLAGQPADGSAPKDAPIDAVVWVDQGDEVIVYLDSLRTEIAGDVLLVAVDLETDQTGRATVVVPFAVGSSPADRITLITDSRPRGPALLVERWGEAIQQAAYAAILDISDAHAEERGGRPRAIYVKDGQLHFEAELEDRESAG